MYVVKHCISVDDEVRTHVFGFVKWYLKSEDQLGYRAPLEVWHRNLYFPQGPASFIPIQQIMGKYASAPEGNLKVILPIPMSVEI
jgi:hypothetical protein